MSSQDLIKMAWQNLMARKLRTALTLLGVMIGTTAIIVMMSLGYGIQESNVRMIEGMGDLTLLDVFPDPESSQAPQSMTRASLNKLESIDHIEVATPVYSSGLSLKAGMYEASYINLQAMDLRAYLAFNWPIEKGKLMGTHDDKVLFGGKVASQFYNPRDNQDPEFDQFGMYIEPEAPFDPMMTKVNASIEEGGSMFGTMMGMGMGSSSSTDNSEGDKSKSIPLEVSGVLEATGEAEKDNTIYTTLENYTSILRSLNVDPPKMNKFEQVKIKVDDPENVESVQSAIKQEGFDSFGLTNILDQIKQSMKIVSLIFLGIGGISFLVAAIGIANTMIMSIYERTREIGVMKVIGASVQDIQKLFLTEAGFIGLLGGILGVVFSLLVSLLINVIGNAALRNSMGNVADYENVSISIVPPWLVVAALLFSIAVGLLAGYFPARRAMKLSALDAIRSE